MARRLKEAVGVAGAAAAARDGTAEDIVRSADEAVRVHQVGRCRLTLSNPR
jgi:hypothetical protein